MPYRVVYDDDDIGRLISLLELGVIRHVNYSYRAPIPPSRSPPVFMRFRIGDIELVHLIFSRPV